MSIQCVSQLRADPSAIEMPGSVELTFDVQVDGEISGFQVKYVIITNDDLVRFASGRPDETVAFTAPSAQQRVSHRANFVCADPTQQPTGFVSFSIEARVIVGGTLECTPIGHPAIRVTSWGCAHQGGAGAFTLHVASATLKPAT